MTSPASTPVGTTIGTLDVVLELNADFADPT
jgi:hypothetical protein